MCFVLHFNYDHQNMVFIDEMGYNACSAARRYGWSPRGQTAYVSYPFRRGEKLTFIGAINYRGPVAYQIQSGAANAESFSSFVLNVLMPTVLPGGLNSIIVMDNCRIHKSAELLACLQALGVTVLFLPPYSPDLDPIELVFGWIRKWCRRNFEACRDDPENSLAIAFLSVPPDVCCNFVQHCGYTV
jgi:transposase